MRRNRINVSRQITIYLGIDEIEFTATIKYCFIDSPSVHTLCQTLQQSVAILGAVIAMLLILHNIESDDIVSYRGKAVYCFHGCRIGRIVQL